MFENLGEVTMLLHAQASGITAHRMMPCALQLVAFLKLCSFSFCASSEHEMVWHFSIFQLDNQINMALQKKFVNCN